MGGKLIFGAGVAIGYVLGTRAGRERLKDLDQGEAPSGRTTTSKRRRRRCRSRPSGSTTAARR